MSDTIAGAVPLTLGTVSEAINNAALTTETGENYVPGVGRTAWFKVTATTSGSLMFDAFYSTSPERIVLTVYLAPSGTATLPSHLSFIQRVYGQPSQRHNITASAGSTYYVQVDVDSAVTSDYRVVATHFSGDFVEQTLTMGNTPDGLYDGKPYTSFPAIHGPYSRASFGHDGTDTTDAAIHAAVVGNTSAAGGAITLHQASFVADRIAALGSSDSASTDGYLFAKAQLDEPFVADENTVFLSAFVNVQYTYHAAMPTPAKRNRGASLPFLTTQLYVYDDPAGATFPGPDMATLTITGAGVGTPPTTPTVYNGGEFDFGVGLGSAIRDDIMANLIAGRALFQGWAAVSSSPSDGYEPDWVDYFSNIRLRVTYWAYQRPPLDDEPPVEERWIRRPLRMHPRSDALGMSSTRRYGTNPRSIQASMRRGGGTYI